MKLSTLIEELDKVKRDLIASGLQATSEATKQRELKAALELHRIGTRLDRVLKALVPFAIDPITTKPLDNQKELWPDTNATKLDRKATVG